MAVNELLCYDVAYFKKNKEYFVESAWAPAAKTLWQWSKTVIRWKI